MSYGCRFLVLLILTMIFSGSQVLADPAEEAARELEQALHLSPDLDNGKKVYATCAVCHLPEGWGQADGYYPQIAGQLRVVVIKQLADIRARNRDTPTMLPFTMVKDFGVQDIADVSAYIERLPMNPKNSIGPGTDLEHGTRVYKENCVECHGENGEGIERDHMPLIQGQHYSYLVRQFEWIKSGKRRNGDKLMQKQIQGFSDRDISAVMDYVSRLRPPESRLADRNWRNPDFPYFVRPLSGARTGMN